MRKLEVVGVTIARQEPQKSNEAEYLVKKIEYDQYIAGIFATDQTEQKTRVKTNDVQRERQCALI
jgi:hypothetical protein